MKKRNLGTPLSGLERRGDMLEKLGAGTLSRCGAQQFGPVWVGGEKVGGVGAISSYAPFHPTPSFPLKEHEKKFFSALFFQRARPPADLRGDLLWQPTPYTFIFCVLHFLRVHSSIPHLPCTKEWRGLWKIQALASQRGLTP